MRSVLLPSLILTGVFTIALFSLELLEAQVMTSPSYEIQSDSVNVGGGLSTSSSYVQESTVGEIATGPSDSTSFSLRAGYQQMQEVYLSLSTPNDVDMDPALGGLTAGTSNGSTTVTVITDSPTGYQLTIEAENSPAMQSPTGSIADYAPVGAADFLFTTDVSDVHFGFSPAGVDITSAYLDDGDECGVGGLDTALACWDGLSTTPTTIAQSGTPNQPSGATTTIHFRVGIGGGTGVEAGVYTATTTITALPL